MICSPWRNRLSKEEYVSSGSTFTMDLTVSVLVLLAAIGLSLVVSLMMKALILSPITKTVEVIEAVAGKGYSQGGLSELADNPPYLQ